MDWLYSVVPIPEAEFGLEWREHLERAQSAGILDPTDERAANSVESGPGAGCSARDPPAPSSDADCRSPARR